ncbi:UPF0175 family protein [Candidatus Acetothermia bacterium]|nr:UPF0175 family protein [Candidatus Acetothermia bacterium]
MTLKKVEVELPEELWKLAGIPAKKASAKFQEILVAELVRQGKLSQGRAAELLGVDRWEIMDLLAKYDVPTTSLTEAELDCELQSLRQLRREKP